MRYLQGIFPLRAAGGVVLTAMFVVSCAGVDPNVTSVTPWGADCSGMVQTMFGLHGVALPRDARQQAELGTEVALSPDAWRPGDLLFFSDRTDGRITHVAIAAPQGTLMHVAIGRGGFAVEHLEGTTDPYTIALMGRVRSAKRVL